MRTTSAKLTDAAPGEDLSGPDVEDGAWLDVAVPGDVHQALLASERIADPDHGLQNADCAWMEERDWWYRLRFDGPETDGSERLLLRLDGLDTFATLWLDGEPFGASANAFRPFVAEVTPGEHLLAVCFHQPLTRATQSDPLIGMRKPAFSYGWDFAPRRPAIGMSGPAEVLRQRVAALDAVQFQTLRLDDTQALVVVGLDVEQFAPASSLVAQVRLRDPEGRLAAEAAVDVTDSYVAAQLTVVDPQLWWTHDRGEPSRYALEVDLVADGQVVAEDRRQVGIRTIALDESADPDEPGSTFFRFVLNGVPLSVKGANWVPAATAIGAVPEGRCARLIGLAQQANMNMLRVWGGGTYEPDAFYDTCDRLGLLVWQDFMFGNSRYEDSDPLLLKEIEAEARHQVRRLRTHPSLALWCGNNEVEMLADLLTPGQPYPGSGIFDTLLPQVVAEEGGGDYRSTSPSRGNSQQHGDRHAWKVWHAVDIGDEGRPAITLVTDGRSVEPRSTQAQEYTAEAVPELYLKDQGRFISEYGLASAPCLETLARCTDPGELVLGGPQVTHRLRPGKLGPRNKLDLMLAATTGVPQDVRDLVDLSQLMQAEGTKLGAEHFRRRWPHCSGSLIWQLNDCWPSISWSMIDVDERPKAVWAYARRFFAPVLASFAPTPTGVELWLTHEGAEALHDTLVVRQTTFGGDVLWEREVDVASPGGTSAVVASWDLAVADDSYLSVRGASVAYNRHFFVPVKDLDRVATSPSYTVSGNEITVTAVDLTLMVHAVLPEPTVVFSDNHFDLEAGQSRTITASSTELSGLEVRSR